MRWHLAREGGVGTLRAGGFLDGYTPVFLEYGVGLARQLYVEGLE